jgi:hypothetical protein
LVIKVTDEETGLDWAGTLSGAPKVVGKGMADFVKVLEDWETHR